MTSSPRANLWLLISIACYLQLATGCRTTAPINVWRPAKVSPESGKSVALVPIIGNPRIADSFQEAMLTQRPPVRSDLLVMTAEQLIQASPVRLASTEQLSNDLVAINAARSAGADYVLLGKIVDSNLDLTETESTESSPKEQNFNQVFFQRLGTQNKAEKELFLTTSWQVLEVETGRPVYTHQVRVQADEVAKRYPDLQSLAHDPNRQLISACAREAWKAVYPSVETSQVSLASPLFQPGSFRVRWGVRAAKKGNWPTAERLWQSAADSLLPSPAAHHNLAIAKAAREDFSGAKKELQQATGLMSRRLPPETLVWLDEQHKRRCQALRLDEPEEGWAFKEHAPQSPEFYSVPAVDPAALPWWYQ